MRVLLICMPFAALDRPALGLSLLKAAVLRAGHECEVAYLNLDFAVLLGDAGYRRIAEGLPFTALAGEWVFAEALWGEALGGCDDYAKEVLGPWRVDERRLASLERARGLARAFVEEVATTVDWGAYDVVGFSSFGAQNAASLALAKRVKDRHPRVTVVIGGHNWSGSMGVALHEHFPFVDYAFLGEADESLPLLLSFLQRGEAPPAIPGVSPGGENHVGKGPFVRLDDLPVPDHSDFFARLARCGLSSPRSVVPLETSRGCWWAAGRSGCSFCALNYGQLRYRSKTPSRILSEIQSLEDRWPDQGLEIVDNVVSSQFLEEVLPRLAERPPAHGISMKVRPDVTPEQLMMVRRVNGSLLCGIESLSDDLLGLMNKGVGSLEAIRLLKWCDALGIPVDWNMLWAIPGDRPDDYRTQVDLVPGLCHLEPPKVFAPVMLERSSPLWRQATDAEEKVSPAPAYRYVYPLGPDEIEGIAYFFDGAYTPTLRTGLQASRLAERLSTWRRERDPGRLVASCDEHGIVTIHDSRGRSSARDVVLQRDQSMIFSACDDPVTIDTLLSVAGRESHDSLSEEDLLGILAGLEDAGLLVRSGRRYLNLATSWEDSTAVAGAAPLAQR
jgi:ribosomal peptide maturation radical SAM protein 1